MVIQKARQLSSCRRPRFARLAHLLDQRRQPLLRIDGRDGLWIDGQFVSAEALVASLCSR